MKQNSGSGSMVIKNSPDFLRKSTALAFKPVRGQIQIGWISEGEETVFRASATVAVGQLSPSIQTCL